MSIRLVLWIKLYQTSPSFFSKYNSEILLKFTHLIDIAKIFSLDLV